MRDQANSLKLSMPPTARNSLSSSAKIFVTAWKPGSSHALLAFAASEQRYSTCTATSGGPAGGNMLPMRAGRGRFIPGQEGEGRKQGRRKRRCNKQQLVPRSRKSSSARKSWHRWEAGRGCNGAGKGRKGAEPRVARGQRQCWWQQNTNPSSPPSFTIHLHSPFQVYFVLHQQSNWCMSE